MPAPGVFDGGVPLFQFGQGVGLPARVVGVPVGADGGGDRWGDGIQTRAGDFDQGGYLARGEGEDDVGEVLPPLLGKLKELVVRGFAQMGNGEADVLLDRILIAALAGKLGFLLMRQDIAQGGGDFGMRLLALPVDMRFNEVPSLVLCGNVFPQVFQFLIHFKAFIPVQLFHHDSQPFLAMLQIAQVPATCKFQQFPQQWCTDVGVGRGQYGIAVLMKHGVDGFRFTQHYPQVMQVAKLGHGGRGQWLLLQKFDDGGLALGFADAALVVFIIGLQQRPGAFKQGVQGVAFQDGGLTAGLVMCRRSMWVAGVQIVTEVKS